MKVKTITSSIKASLPVFFGYIAIGIAFGLVLVQSGYAWWIALIMSLFMYAGAAQFIAVGLFAAGTPLYAILITEFFVNIRHIVYGLSLITKFKDAGKYKPYLIFALTDETYSLLTSTEVPEDVESKDYYFFVSLFDQFYWVAGSVIGALVGSVIPFDLTGVDFALTALFAVLMVEQLLKTKDFVSVGIGIITTLGAILLYRFGLLGASSNILLVALSLGIALIAIFKRGGKVKNESDSN